MTTEDFNKTDTIAAIATPMGAGGVGIVRISGPAAVHILARLINRPEAKLGDRRMIHGWVIDPVENDRLDEVLAVTMRAPRSYTGEDVVEVHGHGGPVNMGRILRAVLRAGARAATPGEFTRRAFSNGRMDLTRAEAVAQIIGAASEQAVRVAQRQLAGTLGESIAKLRRQTLALLAEVEASIDFPEEGLEFSKPQQAAATAEAIGGVAWALVQSYGYGRALTQGIEVALVGTPNVGKSSLLNALLGEERAVVTDQSGTTRDYVEGRVIWDGIPVMLIDTAGLRETQNEVEQKGLALGQARARRADLCVWVLDATRWGDDQRVRTDGEGVNTREIKVWNKIDLVPAPYGTLGVSAKTGEGLALLRQEVLRRAAGDATEDVVISSERQKECLERVANSAKRAANLFVEDGPAEIIAFELREAAWQLGRITGEDIEEDMLDVLFSKFCIGK